jgi:hypothetical protein
METKGRVSTLRKRLTTTLEEGIGNAPALSSSWFSIIKEIGND